MSFLFPKFNAFYPFQGVCAIRAMTRLVMMDGVHFDQIPPTDAEKALEQNSYFTSLSPKAMGIKMEALELARLGDGTIWESSGPSLPQFIEQTD